jgi:hypothetical protein
MILGLVGGMSFLIWKMKLQKKIIDHLSGIVFRDVGGGGGGGVTTPNGTAGGGGADIINIASVTNNSVIGTTNGNSARNPFPSSQ